ncbi:FAD-dependent oxidoreductase [Clostridium sp. AM58-1XD]|uniref:FAD-dependent oxidoreductase n=1 Tax=Clostridium sp. AM58-1XD TaxID=2292307 RepID=UPI000E536C94|nr:FAD-dependent oxidoreductase [Clostridium sp. AM58-1XD]RGY97017.1 FAD-dependent oxidoreductase [Clostridium sp. AM58-1XD]
MLEYDIVIVGGGTAGAVAALAAARNGCQRVLLVEAGSHVGGLSAIGMTWGGFFDNNYRQVIGGIPHELVKKCQEIAGRGYFQYHGDGDKWITGLASVDGETARYVIEKELYDTGCDIMLFSILDGVKMENGRIEQIEVVSRLGKESIRAKYFIDATGELVLADKAGVRWEHGREGETQCTSNMFRVLGVDMDKYEKFLNQYINTEDLDPWKKETGAIRRGIEYWCPWKPNGFSNMPKSLGIYYHGKNNDVILNCTSISINPLDIMELSRASYMLRKEAFQVLEYLKEHVDGFQEAYIAAVYDLAARETRRMIGDYVLTMDDIVVHRRFDDAVGMGAYPPDIHDVEGSVHIPSTREFNEKSDGAYDIPLRSMTTSIANLLVAGKCISATFEAQSAARGIGPCMVEGQGVGTAAALALDSGVSDIHEISIRKLRQMLEEQGVIF